MKALTLSIQNAENGIYLWVINLSSFILEKCFLNRNSVLFEGNIGDCIEIRGKYVSSRYPIIDVEEISVLGRCDIDVKRLLEYKSANPTAIKENGITGRIMKLDSIEDIKLNGTRADLDAIFFGLEGAVYRVILNDARWVSFWKDEKDDLKSYEESTLKSFNSLKNVYFILDYEQPSNGTALVCGGMVAI